MKRGLTHSFPVIVFALLLLTPLVFNAAAQYANAASSNSVHMTDNTAARNTLTAQSTTAPGLLKTPVFKTTTAGEGYNLVTWSAVSRATSYEVQRKSGSNGSWKTIQVRGGNQHIFCPDYNAEPGVKSYYRVRALAGGKRSSWSRVISMTAAFSIPTLTKLTKTKISWKSVDYATSYEVLSRSDQDDKWRVLGSTSETSFSIPKKFQSTKSYFTVRACNDICKSRLRDLTFSMRDMRFSNVKTLIEGDSCAAPVFSFPKRAARKLGLNWTSRAVSGSRVSSTHSNAAKNIYRRSMKKGFQGYDLIIFRMGSNDYNNSVAPGMIGNENPKTMAGAYDLILKRARKDSPNAKIVLCTPLTRGEYSGGVLRSNYSLKNKQGYTASKYRSIIIKLAKKYDCYLYDMKNSGIVTAKNLLTATFDRVHPNYVSAIRLGDKFEKYLRDTVLAD